VDEARDRGDDDEHHGGQRVDAQHPAQVEIADLDPAHDLDLGGGGMRTGPGRLGGEPVAEEDDPAQHRGGDEEARGDVFAHPVPDHAAEQPRDQRPDQGQKDDCLDHGVQPFITLTSSTAMEPRLRKKMTRIASPIAASAAATVRIKSAKTWPARSPSSAEKATKLMFTASRISSTDIRMMMMFFLLRKIPNTPIVNRMAPTVRK